MARNSEISGGPLAVSHQQSRSLQQRLFSSGVWSLIGRFGAMLSFALTSAVLASPECLGSTEFGAYALLIALSTSLSAIVSGSVGTSVLSLLKRHQCGSNGRLSMVTGFAVVCVTVLLFSVYAMAGFVLASVIPPHYEAVILANRYGLWIFLGAIFSGVTVILSDVFRATDRFFLASAFCGRNGNLVENVVFLAFLLMPRADTGNLSTVDRVIFFRCAAGLVSLLTALAGFGATFFLPWFRRLISGDGRPTIPDSTQLTTAGPDPADSGTQFFRTARLLLSMVVPLSVNEIAGLFHEHLDLVIISMFANLRQVAVFAVIKQAVILMNAPLLMANVVYRPFVAELYAKHDKGRLQIAFSGTAVLACVTALPFLTFLLLCPEVFLGFYGPDFSEGTNALRIAMLGVMVFLGCGSCGLSLSLGGMQTPLMMIRCLSAAVYLGLMVMLSPSFGVAGMAMSYALSIAGSNLLCVWVARTRLGVSSTIPLSLQEWRSLLACLLQSVATLRTGRFGRS
ncbi:MAG: hypothetical protein R3C17_02195 [Planctomycetaceae bacterium]